ncbi:MAG: Dabb family protein [Christensenellaceae bacterium]|jgi:hypothetical protein|nr:Dabb family protein [Christensenellaceae bacterium]
MIKHIVLYKLKNPDLDTEKTVDVLRSMVGRVPQIIELETGIDFLKSERSYDVALTVIVNDISELNLYQLDQYHCSVVKPFMHSVRSASVAIDYEI